MRALWVIIPFIALLASCTTETKDADSFLLIKDGAIVSTHALPFLLEQPEGFRTSVPVTHFPTFNDHPFKVSLAGFFKSDEALFVHAEQVLDSSGVLDYSGLPQDTLAGKVFGIRSQCAELEAAEIKEEHDLSYLQENGFRLLPAVYLKQFLMSTDDHNFEYIISYAVNIDSCTIPDSDPVWNQRISDRLNELVRLEEQR